MFRRFVHFEVLVIDKYHYGENFFSRDVKFCPRTGNPPTAYQHLSLAGSRTGGRWCGVQAKEIRNQSKRKTITNNSPRTGQNFTSRGKIFSP
jgi:hypothetical protein